MNKQNKSNDINALLSEAPEIIIKNKEKHLPWFATTVAVVITTLLCAGFDGSNIYLSLASQTRDNVILTIILAAGTTFLLNFSCTVIGDMYKRYIQKVGNIKRWMIAAFLIFVSMLFVSVFAFRYGNADGPFISTATSVSLGGGNVAVQNEEVPAIIKYSLATIINISSIVSSFLCFVIGYYNSNPAKEQTMADIKILSDLIKHRSVLVGIKDELDSIKEDTIRDFENKRLKAAKDYADSLSKSRKTRVREIMSEKIAEDSAEVGDIVYSSKNIPTAKSPVGAVEDVAGYTYEFPEEPFGEEVSEPTESEETAEIDDSDDVADFFKNIAPVLPPKNENMN